MPIALSDGLSVELAIACEDVREERGNKISVMGMFTDQIAVAQFPADIRIAFFFTVRSDKAQEVILKTRITVDGEIAGHAHMQLSPTETASLGNVIVPLGFVRMSTDGYFALSMAVGESENWVEVIRKTVSIGQVT
jgi:hypothetical protein